MLEKPIIVYGASGLAREVEWLIHRINQVKPTFRFEGYVVTDKDKLGSHDSISEVVGDEMWLMKQKGLYVALGIGTPKIRLDISRRLSESISDDYFPCLVDPSVVYDSRSAVIEPGATVTAGCIATTGIQLKRFSYVNLNCTIGHETIIGEGSVLNPSANISGGVNVGQGVLIGTGAQVLQYLELGDYSTIGAGAVVTKSVARDSMVLGVPAKSRG